MVGDDLETGLVELGYVDGWVGAEEGGVDGRERGSEGAVGLGVGVGGEHESEKRILHGCLLGGSDGGGGSEEGEGEDARLDGG